MMARAGTIEPGECVDLGTRIEEGVPEGAVDYGCGLADELVQRLSGHRAVALVVDIRPARRGRPLSVDAHVESHGGARVRAGP